MKTPTPRDLLLVPIVGLLLAWLLLLRPDFLAGPASYVIVSGDSMEPTLHDGDLAITRSQGGYAIGDVVAFRVPKGKPGEGSTVIHRIASRPSHGGLVLQGDNNEWKDSWRPTEDEVLGKMWFRLPGAGRWLAVLRAPAVMAAVAAGVAVFLVLSGHEKKPQGQLSPAPPDAPAASRRPRRGRFRPPAPPLSLFLIMLLATVAVVAFGARH